MGSQASVNTNDKEQQLKKDRDCNSQSPAISSYTS